MLKISGLYPCLKCTCFLPSGKKRSLRAKREEDGLRAWVCDAMDAEKLVFALLACVLLAGLAFLALGAAPKQQVAFFAYGTNLAKNAMNARAGGFINATAAGLEGYGLVFASQDARPTEFGVATPVQNESASVKGALYYLTPEQMAALDRQSGVPNFYGIRMVKVALPDGSAVDAQAYFLAGNTHSAAPSRPYYLAVQGGMQEWSYDESGLDAAMAAASSN
ncbi:MAG: gamma-glutamylcyclotransferase [Candidatus Micrarchaeota archaeon]|nr:gamma-glutamylcyclotransferase [Candidatus Micrarchaeota archaeon]